MNANGNAPATTANATDANETAAPRTRATMSLFVDTCLSPSTVLSLALVSFCLIGCVGPQGTSRPPGFNMESLTTGWQGERPEAEPSAAASVAEAPADSPVNHGSEAEVPVEIASPAPSATLPAAEAALEPVVLRDPHAEAVERAVSLFEAGRFAEAGTLLSREILEGSDAALENKIWPLLNKVRTVTHFAEPGSDGLPVYTVEAGDTLSAIGKKLNVQWERLAFANRIASADRVRPGQKLRVRGDAPRVVVRVDRRDVLVVVGSEVIERFPVGVGAEATPTPRGAFRVATRIARPSHEKIKGGDPANPLGAFWLGLSNAKGGTGYGIHGTIDPASIGAAVSEGCVRMRDEDITALAGWLEIGAEVEIR